GGRQALRDDRKDDGPSAWGPTVTPNGRPVACFRLDRYFHFHWTARPSRVKKRGSTFPPDMSSPEQSDCILIADDHPANLLALEAVLEPLDRPIIKSSSGVEALRYLLDHDCSLALLDVAMPGL